MTETVQKLKRTSQAIVQDKGREPTCEDLVKITGMPVKKIREILKTTQEAVSIEAPVIGEGSGQIGDFIKDFGVPSPPDTVIHISLKEQIEEALKNLTDRETKIIKMRFGIGDEREHTLEEVGKQFNVTRERIRQIESRALKKLQEPRASYKLKSFA
jgi:RNA polymerase primary sigma factor